MNSYLATISWTIASASAGQPPPELMSNTRQERFASLLVAILLKKAENETQIVLSEGTFPCV